MKGYLLKISGTTLLVLVLLASLCMVIYAEQEPIVIKFSTHDPPTGTVGPVIQNWLNEIEKQTENRVKIEDYWGGALFSQPEALKGVADGVADISFVFADFFPKQLPLHQVFQVIPRGPVKWENKKYVYYQSYEEMPELVAELEAWNQKPIMILAGLPLAFCSTKPITGIDDLQGNLWRASSRWNLAYLKNAGAIPVSIPWADCYMALQTGTIDGILTNYDGIHMTKLDEAAPHVLVTYELWMSTPFLYTINLDTWNSLPKDVQEGILEASRLTEIAYEDSYSEAFSQIESAQREMGCTINYITEEDVVKWVNEPELKKLQAIWIDENKTEGRENADEIMERIKEIVNEAIEKEK